MLKSRFWLTCTLILALLWPVMAEPNGSVSISLAEFLKLKNEQASTETQGPPKLFLLSGATYKVAAQGSWAEVVANATLEVKSRKWQEVPLLGNSAVLSATSLNGKPVPVYQKNGKFHLLTREPGRHKLRLVYKLPLKKSGRTRSFGFTPLDSPVCHLNFVLPQSGLKLTTNPATPVRLLNGSALMTLPGGADRTTQISWEPKQTASGTVRAARLRAEVQTTAQISETAVRCTSQVLYDITGEVEVLRLEVPLGIEVLEVEAPGISGWKVTDSGGVRQIHAALSRPATGSVALRVVYEKALENINTTWELPWISVKNARAVKGFVALACSGSIEVTPADLEQAREVEPSDLPSGLKGGKVLRALKYTAQPYQIALETRKGEEVNVLTASIDSAQARTLITPDGKVVSTFHYQIRNNRKQYLEFQLPPGLTVWSAFVNGQATKPVETESGTVKLALVTSTDGAAFPVELTCVSHSEPGFFLGTQSLSAPSVDVPISSLEWTLFWPESREVWSFDTDMQKLVEPRTASPAWRRTSGNESFRDVDGRRGGKDKKTRERSRGDDQKLLEEDPSNMPIKAPKPSLQAQLESSKNQKFNDYRNNAMLNIVRTTSLGSFPVRVRVPEAGQPHSFQKLMVTKEMPTLTIRYYDPGLTKALAWGGLLLLLAIGLGLGSRIRRKAELNND